MTFPAVALGNQWTNTFQDEPDMKAKIDDNLNAMAANMSLWGRDFAAFRAKGAINPGALAANYNWTTFVEDFTDPWAGTGPAWDATNKRWVCQKAGLYAIQAGFTQSSALNGVLEILTLPAPFSGVIFSGQMGNAASYGQDLDMTANLVAGNTVSLQMRGALALPNAAGISTWTYLTVMQIGY